MANHCDILCLSETFLDSNILFGNVNLDIPRYYLVRVDHPLNTKRGGACIYFLQECISFEMRIGGKLCNFISLYRSPNQCFEELETFADNLELNLDAIAKNNLFKFFFLVTLIAKLSKWYQNDSTSYKGIEINGITTHILINQPT